MIRPEVRTEVTAQHGPPGFTLNVYGKGGRTLLLPGHNFMEPGVGASTQPAPKLCDGKGKPGTNVCHAFKSMPPGGRVKPQGPYSLCGQIVYAWDMTNTTNPWPQRDVYRQDLEEYLDGTGKTQADFCAEVTARLAESGGKRDSLSLAHLRNCLYRKDKYLSFEILKVSSAIFRKSVTNYIDDPGAEIAGQDMSQDSEEDRFFAKMLIKGARPRDLTDEQRQFIIEDLFRTVARVRAMAAPGLGQPRQNPPRVQSDVQPDLPSSGPRRTPRPKR